MGLAWDYFDETDGGKDTLHRERERAKPVTINTQHNQNNNSKEAGSSKNSKRRRTHEPRGLLIEPY